MLDLKVQPVVRNVDGDPVGSVAAGELEVAERKFWQGAKGVTDAIDQLFGYASWRDTKLALIMFVRERA
jgi:hypothetical protein